MPLRDPFSMPDRHLEISKIITHYSTNSDDIRSAMLTDINFHQVKSILDLGCGFGFLAQKLKDHIDNTVRILGIDHYMENKTHFINAFQEATPYIEFSGQDIHNNLHYPSKSFDLILSSYSLYFFPETIHDIARLLRPEGTFLVATHSNMAFIELCELLDISFLNSPINKLLNNFSTQNGQEKLEQCFRSVKALDYKNELVFTNKDYDDLKKYLIFKLPLILPKAELTEDRQSSLLKIVDQKLEEMEEVRIRKDDTIFFAGDPIWP